MSHDAHDGLRHTLLDAVGVDHAFGTRASVAPASLRPKQVHGTAVAHARGSRVEPAEADAIVTIEAQRPVAVITADCVPILAATADGRAVAAIHAGWRGLSQGVVAAGIAALRNASAGGGRIVAVSGPCIGPCCYEVDEPVLSAVEARFGRAAQGAIEPGRPGRAQLDLAALVRLDLRDSGVEAADCASIEGACTACDSRRFHSYRRDGSRAGRLVHHIAVRPIY